MTDALVELRQRLPDLSTAERRVAEAVIKDPSLVIESTITQLAAACDTSPATVARMCRGAGYKGYKNFRMLVAAAHSREEAAKELFRVSDAEITLSDSLAELVTKVAYQETRTIEETARYLDLDALDRVATAIPVAERVDIFGVGSSGLIAQDLQQKLHRVGILSFSSADAHLALTSVAITTAKSVAIAISHTGATLETNRFVEMAGSSGALTVAITNNPGSPLGVAADLVLATSSRETGFRAGAMSSRLAQMAIVDFLVVRMVQLNFERADELLHRSYQALAAQRIGGNG